MGCHTRGGAVADDERGWMVSSARRRLEHASDDLHQYDPFVVP